MTNKQKQIKKRNAEVLKLSRTLTIEELAVKFNVSIPSIYRIIKKYE